MPVHRQPSSDDVTSVLWPSGGRHRWPSGRTAPRQTHPRGHLVYAATGVLSVHTERGTSVVPANRMAWTPAGFAHQHSTHGHTDMRIVFLTAGPARRLPDRPAVFLASALVREIMLALTDRESADSPRGRSAAARLERVLVDELDEAAEQPLHLPAPRDDRLRTLGRILTERPAEPASLAELGATVGASPRTLSRLLHDELGMTFYQWRTQLRVGRALVLLAEGHDVTGTAHACGWANPSSFVAAFANIVGTTPSHYRTRRQPAAGDR